MFDRQSSHYVQSHVAVELGCFPAAPRPSFTSSSGILSGICLLRKALVHALRIVKLLHHLNARVKHTRSLHITCSATCGGTDKILQRRCAHACSASPPSLLAGQCIPIHGKGSSKVATSVACGEHAPLRAGAFLLQHLTDATSAARDESGAWALVQRLPSTGPSVWRTHGGRTCCQDLSVRPDSKHTDLYSDFVQKSQIKTGRSCGHSLRAYCRRESGLQRCRTLNGAMPTGRRQSLWTKPLFFPAYLDWYEQAPVTVSRV